MSDIRYNLQFDKLCNILQLGEVVSEVEAVYGGLLHRLFAVQTTQGKYAVKALNPQIMLRPTAMQNYVNSELIANAAANIIPALPAKKFNGLSIQELDNQFYLLFDWVRGRSLKASEIKVSHCEKIGTILADIHRMDFSELGILKDCSDNEQLIEWNYYLQKGQENSAVWVDLLMEIIDQLYIWNNQAAKASKMLASNLVLSHRDLDSKNVMWNQDNPLIIDWESAGFINPMQDLTETAVYWSEDENGKIDKDKFISFVRAYKNKYGEVEADWKAVLSIGFLGKLGWLEYSLKRSLWIECTDEKEQQLGAEQVIGTIKALISYADIIAEVEVWLNNEMERR